MSFLLFSAILTYLHSGVLLLSMEESYQKGARYSTPETIMIFSAPDVVPTYAYWGKRTLDLTLCLIALPFIVIVMGIITLLIWIEDEGPALFVQIRTGKDGQRFAMYKFRTMVKNAEALKAQLMHLNQLQPPDFKIPNDPRITKIGRFLRHSSLDELPQIFNILKGDMSLVGPRPTSFTPDTYEPWQLKRLDVLPGLTGLWQIHGRSDLQFRERVLLDLEYIERQSLFLDMQIICQTIGTVFKGKGAY